MNVSVMISPSLAAFPFSLAVPNSSRCFVPVSAISALNAVWTCSAICLLLSFDF